MDLPLSRAVADVDYLTETTSTNDDLMARAADAPEFTVVLTTSQTAGRGRLGRVWQAPPGKTLAASVLLKPLQPSGERVPLNAFGWLPLMAGLAMTRAVAAVVPDGDTRVTLKWPNDVHIDGKKVAGLLAELMQGGVGVVIGSGVNLSIPADSLPTETSTSIGLHSPQRDGVALTGDDLLDAVLGGYLAQLRALYSEYLREGADAAASGLLDDVSERCSSLGQQVRVELPDGSTMLGVAIDLDSTGRLRVKRSSDGSVQAVAAGDVTHLRYE